MKLLSKCAFADFLPRQTVDEQLHGVGQLANERREGGRIGTRSAVWFSLFANTSFGPVNGGRLGIFY